MTQVIVSFHEICSVSVSPKLCSCPASTDFSGGSLPGWSSWQLDTTGRWIREGGAHRALWGGIPSPPDSTICEDRCCSLRRDHLLPPSPGPPTLIVPHTAVQTLALRLSQRTFLLFPARSHGAGVGGRNKTREEKLSIPRLHKDPAGPGLHGVGSIVFTLGCTTWAEKLISRPAQKQRAFGEGCCMHHVPSGPPSLTLRPGIFRGFLSPSRLQTFP